MRVFKTTQPEERQAREDAYYERRALIRVLNNIKAFVTEGELILDRRRKEARIN